MLSKLSRNEQIREQRRKEILAASRNRFFQHTYDEVSMGDIARDVKIVKGTLYLYFKNKKSLFFTIVTEGMTILRDAFKDAVKKEKRGKDKILSFSNAFFEYILEYKDYYRLNLISRTPRFTKMLELEEIENAKDYVSLVMELFKITFNAVSKGIRDGSLRKDLDPMQTTMFVSNSIETAVYTTPEFEILFEKNKNLTKKQYFEHSMNIILNGIEGN